MKEVKRTELQKERGVWARHGDSISRSISKHGRKEVDEPPKEF